MRDHRRRFKGRRLKAPAWDGLRPTSDKLRETLFNILAPRIAGARVLDGYAGTGAVGIEALSRGAAHVLFVERDRRAAALIEANLAAAAWRQGYTIECGDVAAVLRRCAAARVRSDPARSAVRHRPSTARARGGGRTAGAATAWWCSSARRGASPTCRPRSSASGT